EGELGSEGDRAEGRWPGGSEGPGDQDVRRERGGDEDPESGDVLTRAGEDRQVIAESFLRQGCPDGVSQHDESHKQVKDRRLVYGCEQAEADIRRAPRFQVSRGPHPLEYPAVSRATGSRG